MIERTLVHSQLVVHPPDANHDVCRPPRLDHRLQVQRLRNQRLIQLPFEGHLARLVHCSRCCEPKEARDDIADVPVALLGARAVEAPLLLGQLW